MSRPLKNMSPGSFFAQPLFSTLSSYVSGGRHNRFMTRQLHLSLHCLVCRCYKGDNDPSLSSLKDTVGMAFNAKMQPWIWSVAWHCLNLLRLFVKRTVVATYDFPITRVLLWTPGIFTILLHNKRFRWFNCACAHPPNSRDKHITHVPHAIKCSVFWTAYKLPLLV